MKNRLERIAELTILLIALLISLIADYLPTIGRYAGRYTARAYHYGIRLAALAYAQIRYGYEARIYLADLLELHSLDTIGIKGIDNHGLAVMKHFKRKEWPIARLIKLALIRISRYVRAAYSAAYGLTIGNVIAQYGIPITVTVDSRLERIRSAMADY